MLHTRFIVMTWSSLNNVVRLFERDCARIFTFRDYMVADKAEFIPFAELLLIGFGPISLLKVYLD
jgi:hypothetical protein